jgi:uncharacterized protein involved in exopolysaccharide biosynthesis
MQTESPISELNEREEPRIPEPNIDQDAKGKREISLLDLLIIVIEQRRLVLWTTAGSTIVALLVSLLLPKSYTATATLLPPQENSSLSTGLSAQLGNFAGMAALAGGGLGLKNPNDKFVGMLKSRTVEDAMIQRFELMKEYHTRTLTDTRKRLERYADVDGDAKDGMIHISIEDHDPRRAAELANGYVEQFRSLTEHLAISEASQRRLFFERQLERAKDNLAVSEEALKRTEQATGVIQLDSQARALIESAAALRAQIAAREVQIQGMQTYATGTNSQLVQAQQELKGLREQLAKLGGSDVGTTDELVVPKGKVTEAGLDYVRKLRDVKYNETIFEILARQFELAKLDEAREGALVQVVDTAIPPDKRSFPKRGMIVTGAAIAGFLLGISIALLSAGWKYLSANRATSARMLRLRSQLPFSARLGS